MAKTNWQMDDTVMPADMNQIGQEINDALARGVHHLEDNAFTSSSPGTDYPEGASVMNVDSWDIMHAAGVVLTVRNSTYAQQFIIDGLGVASFRLFTPGRSDFWSPLATVPLDASMLKFYPYGTGMTADTVEEAIFDLFVSLSWAVGTLEGATSANYADSIIKRDASGRAKVAAPSESDDIARKAEVDAAIRPIATKAQAEAGTDNTTSMTPLRVKQAISKNQSDFYEQGIWTPTVYIEDTSTVTYSNIRFGKYTRIGKLVVIHCDVYLSDKGIFSGEGDGAGAVIEIRGLPFIAAAINTPPYILFDIDYFRNLNMERTDKLQGRLRQGRNYIDFVYQKSDSGSFDYWLTWKQLSNNPEFRFQFSYTID